MKNVNKLNKFVDDVSNQRTKFIDKWKGSKNE